MKIPESLDDVRGMATRPFPKDEIHRGDSVLCLACAGFYGSHDVIHVLDAGARSIVGVDLDADKIEVMRRIYPKDRCAFVVGDMFSTFYGKNSFDVVIAEPSLHLCQMAWESDLFLQAARVFICCVWGQVANEIRDTGPSRVSLLKVNDYAGGLYWAVQRLNTK